MFFFPYYKIQKLRIEFELFLLYNTLIHVYVDTNINWFVYVFEIIEFSTNQELFNRI